MRHAGRVHEAGAQFVLSTGHDPTERKGTTDQLLGSALITAGIVFDAAGAVLLATVLFVSKDQAVNRIAARWSFGENNPRRYETPAVKDVLRDRTRGYWGVGLLVLDLSFK